MSQSSRHLATIVVTQRDRFGLAVQSLDKLLQETPGVFELIYVDGGAPRHIGEALKERCEAQGFRYIRHDCYLTPNQARNIGQRSAETKYVVFIDNDVIVAPGWLDALVSCAEETGAEIVTPLICQNLPVHQEVHQAGGEFSDDPEEFFKGPVEARRITDRHTHQGERVSELDLRRGPVQNSEFHCVLARREIFDLWGDLDEGLMATKEHIDFCMTVQKNGGRVILEPASVVTFVFPCREHPVHLEDWPYFALRWSPKWQRKSLEHFREKWSLHGDPYFEQRWKLLNWRHRDGLAKPLLRKVPFLGSSYKFRSLGAGMMTPFLALWSAWLAARNKPYAAVRS